MGLSAPLPVLIGWAAQRWVTGRWSQTDVTTWDPRAHPERRCIRMLAMSSGAALGVWVLIIIAVGLIFYIWNMREESKRTKEALGQSRSANQSLIREKQALEEAAEAAKMLREVKEEAEKRWHEDPEYRREIEEKTQRQVKEEEERL